MPSGHHGPPPWSTFGAAPVESGRSSLGRLLGSSEERSPLGAVGFDGSICRLSSTTVAQDVLGPTGRVGSNRTQPAPSK